MGRIKELRDKVKAEEATDEEKEELTELEGEAAETEEKPKEEEKPEDEKSVEAQIKEAAKTFLEVIGESTKEAKDERKAEITEKGEKKIEKEEELTGDQKVGEFIKAMIVGAKEKLLALSEGVNANGGFLVPQEWYNRIIESREDITVIRPRATVIQTNSNTLDIPQLATKPKVYWTGELATKSTSSFTFSEITLTPYTLAVIITLSRQLVQDATIGLPNGIISYVTGIVAKEIGKEEDGVFMVGNGTGRPTGIDNYTFTSVAAGGALSGDHLIDAYYSLGQGYRANASWILNSRVITVIKQLKDSQNRYLFQDALTDGGYPTLLGRPVLEHNGMGSSNIFFGDISAYFIAEREGISVLQSEEATVSGQSAFERNLVHVRVEERVDGELSDTAAFVEITATGVS